MRRLPPPRSWRRTRAGDTARPLGWDLLSAHCHLRENLDPEGRTFPKQRSQPRRMEAGPREQRSQPSGQLPGAQKPGARSPATECHCAREARGQRPEARASQTHTTQANSREMESRRQTQSPVCRGGTEEAQKRVPRRLAGGSQEAECPRELDADLQERGQRPADPSRDRKGSRWRLGDMAGKRGRRVLPPGPRQPQCPTREREGGEAPRMREDHPNPNVHAHGRIGPRPGLASGGFRSSSRSRAHPRGPGACAEPADRLRGWGSGTGWGKTAGTGPWPTGLSCASSSAFTPRVLGILPEGLDTEAQGARPGARLPCRGRPRRAILAWTAEGAKGHGGSLEKVDIGECQRAEIASTEKQPSDSPAGTRGEAESTCQGPGAGCPGAAEEQGGGSRG